MFFVCDLCDWIVCMMMFFVDWLLFFGVDEVLIWGRFFVWIGYFGVDLLIVVIVFVWDVMVVIGNIVDFWFLGCCLIDLFV